MKKIYHCEDTGSIYWLEGNALMFVSTPQNGVIDFENDGGEVDKVLMKGETTSTGRQLTDLYAQIERELWKQ